MVSLFPPHLSFPVSLISEPPYLSAPVCLTIGAPCSHMPLSVSRVPFPFLNQDPCPILPAHGSKPHPSLWSWGAGGQEVVWDRQAPARLLEALPRPARALALTTQACTRLQGAALHSWPCGEGTGSGMCFPPACHGRASARGPTSSICFPSNHEPHPRPQAESGKHLRCPRQEQGQWCPGEVPPLAEGRSPCRHAH